MPLAPQITNTPDDIPIKSFDISAVTYTSSTATYTATAHTFASGDTVIVSGIAPDGYNGTFVITSIATNTFTIANTTNVAITDAVGNAYSVDNTDYDLSDTDRVYKTSNEDVVDLTAAIDANATAAYNAAISAQADATAAQSSASTAYSTAVAANTAASTAQSTANGKNKVTYSTSTPGSTSNAVGDIWYQYGTSGVNNGRVIAQYMGAGGTSWTQTTVSGLVVANIDAASITTGTLAVALGITGTSGNFSVNAVTGALNATSATIKGQVNATSGYFGDGTNGYSITSSGLTGLGSGVIIGGQIQTSTGNEAVVLDGSTNAIRFKSGGSYVGNIVPLNVGGSAYGLLMHYGSTPDGSGGTRPQMYIGSSNCSISASSSFSIGVSTSAISFNGATYANSNFYVPNHTTTASAANGYVNSTTGLLARSTASSQRYKHDITNLVDIPELDPKALYNLPVRAFRFNKDYLPETDDRSEMLVPGFIAEEVDAIYPVAADYDNEKVETWNDRMIIPALLALIQDQNKRIKQLEGK